MVSQPWTAVASVIWIMLVLVACTVGIAQFQLESAIHETIPCGDEATERKVLAIMNEALEQALKDHIERTFDVMMRNYASGTDEAQTRTQATRGIRGGVNAYIQASRTLADWKLMRCP